MSESYDKNKNPIYTCELDKRVKTLQLYPLEEVIKSTNFCYFNNTVPYAIGYAIYRNVSSICLYGIDYTYKDNIYMAESGRACTEFWCATAVSKGIKVEVGQELSIESFMQFDEEIEEGYYDREDFTDWVKSDFGIKNLKKAKEILENL